MNHIISYHRWQRSSLAAILLAGFLLLISPLSAVAQDIGWSPVDMFFDSTVIGTTATQTLTLTNEDAAMPMSVDEIVWTYNDPGEVTGLPSFQFTADRPVPAELLPGESMEIDITFTAESWSFKMANLLITNSSLNAPSLNYFVMGEGIGSDICSPLADCNGVCTDASSDVNNCGACDNVCETTANAITFCESYTCGFVCNIGYEPVGNLCLPNGGEPPVPECPIDFEDPEGPVISKVDWIQYLADGANIKIKGTASALDELKTTGFFVRDAVNTDYVFFEENSAPKDWKNFLAENMDYPPCFIQTSDEDPEVEGQPVGNWGEAFDLTPLWDELDVECECITTSATAQ